VSCEAIREMSDAVLKKAMGKIHAALYDEEIDQMGGINIYNP
jgi:hypothetical protein